MLHHRPGLCTLFCSAPPNFGQTRFSCPDRTSELLRASSAEVYQLTEQQDVPRCLFPPVMVVTGD